MEAQTTAVTIQDTTSNPAPLGLLGFGMTTVLLNLHNAGLFELSSMILAMGIFYGGIAQIIAGLIEIKKRTLSVRQRLYPMDFSGCRLSVCWYCQKRAGRMPLQAVR